MPEPMPQEWTDAYRYCSLDPLFVDKGDRRDAVKQYVKIVAMLDDSEKEEIYQSVKDYAAELGQDSKAKSASRRLQGLCAGAAPTHREEQLSIPGVRIDGIYRGNQRPQKHVEPVNLQGSSGKYPKRRGNGYHRGFHSGGTKAGCRRGDSVCT